MAQGDSVYLEDLESIALRKLVGTRNLTADVGLDTATATEDSEINNTINYMIDGKMYSRAGAAGTSAVDYSTGASLVLANGEFLLFVLTVDTAGAVTATPGVIDDNTLPEYPAGECPFAVTKIAATGAFTPGTTALGTNSTVTYTEYGVLPEEFA